VQLARPVLCFGNAVPGGKMNAYRHYTDLKIWAPSLARMMELCLPPPIDNSTVLNEKWSRTSTQIRTEIGEVRYLLAQQLSDRELSFCT